MFLVWTGRQEYNKNTTASINAFHVNLCQIVNELAMSPRILLAFSQKCVSTSFLSQSFSSPLFFVEEMLSS